MIKLKKKNLVVLPPLWSDDMSIETVLKLFKTVTLEVLTKEIVYFDQANLLRDLGHTSPATLLEIWSYDFKYMREK